jgi:hypothetical protein
MYNGSTEGVSPDNSLAEPMRLPTELAQHSSASVDMYNGSTEGVSPDNSLAELTRLPTELAQHSNASKAHESYGLSTLTPS